MKKQKLNMNALQVSSFEPQPQAVPGPIRMMTGQTGYCNTCMPTACNWTV